jgi:glycosyltransferase involved in cell wall biosynthesis
MKLLWVKTDFLHPTTRGGQIRTLEMVRRLHRNHEVHYVAFDDPAQPEGLARSSEYCAKAYPVAHRVPARTSPAFALQLIAGFFSHLPVAVGRYRSPAMRRQVAALVEQHKFDCMVCDFLFPAPNIPRLETCILFQHNVESTIWKRYVEHATGLRKLYFELQAKRMLAYEGEVCRSVRKVISVSEADAGNMRSIYGASHVYPVLTGVDLHYFSRPAASPKLADLVFLGSMDWMPNIDGAEWFVRKVLPLIRRRRPDCSLAIVGRKPVAAVTKLAESDVRIIVTGTVPDVRPWLFGSLVSVVPLRIGGGTRLKIYEAMAARVPVVSTAIGAEGLDVSDGENIHLADAPEDFAARCLELLDTEPERDRLASNAWNLIASNYSWDAVTRGMERLLFE